MYSSAILDPSSHVNFLHVSHNRGRVHTWSHRALSTLSTEQIVSELHYSITAIQQVIGTRPNYMRPPFGDLGMVLPLIVSPLIIIVSRIDVSLIMNVSLIIINDSLSR